MNNKRVAAILLVLCLGFSTIAIAGENSNLLVDEIMHGADIGKVGAMIDYGMDASSVARLHGVTPLMAAAFRGKRDIVKLLLKKGADPSVTINIVGFALPISDRNLLGGHSNAAALSRLRGFDVEELGGAGYSMSAFDFAVYGRHRAIAVLLPPYGPDGRVISGTELEQRIAVLSRASREYFFRKNLADIQSWLKVFMVATAMFYQEQGGFPGKTGSMDAGQIGKQTEAGSAWNMMGFGEYPSFPSAVVSVHYIPIGVGETGTADSYVLILQLNHISSGANDRLLIGLSPSADIVISGPETATASPIKLLSGQWVYHYSCHKLTDYPVDPRVLKAFTTSGVEMACH